MPTIIDGTNGVNQVQTNVIEQGDLQLAASSIGVGQTWQDMTASRALATTYTNSTGKPIQISVELACTTTTTHVILINGVTIASHAVAPAGVAGQIYVYIIPSGSTYQAQNTASGITRWWELR